jgi:hypothetical protein
MRRVTYLAARVFNRCKSNKSRLYPCDYVYATSTNSYNLPRGKLLKVSQLRKAIGWKGEAIGFVEAPLVSEIQETTKRLFKIDVYYIPVTAGGKLSYRIGMLDLNSHEIVVSDETYDSGDEAIEKGCVSIFRDNKTKGAY